MIVYDFILSDLTTHHFITYFRLKQRTLLPVVILGTLLTLLTAGSAVPPGSVRGSDVSTDTDNPCSGNVQTQSPELPTTDDSEELDSDIECELDGIGGIKVGDLSDTDADTNTDTDTDSVVDTNSGAP